MKRSIFPISLIATLVLQPSGAIARGPKSPGPAKHFFLPPEKRLEMYFEWQQNLSDAFGSRANLKQLKIYREQDDSVTICTQGIARDQFFTLVSSGGRLYPNVTPKEWLVAGCERSNAVVLR